MKQTSDKAKVLATIFACFLFLLTFSLCEGMARFFYKAPWFEVLLNSDHHKGSDGTLNSYGLRGPAPEGTKRDDHRRILILGDSFTFGAGVEADDEIFPALLEGKLNKDLPIAGVKHFDVLNGGIPGSLTRQWVELWSEVTKKFNPDVLLIVFFIRDGTLMGSIPLYFDLIRQNIVEPNARSFAYQHLYLFRTFKNYLDLKRISAEYTKSYIDAYFGNDEDTQEWQRAQKNIVALKELAEKNSTTPAFVVFPILVDLNGSSPFKKISDHLETFGKSAGLATLNLAPVFLGRNAPDLWVSPFDQHPNAKGHSIAANAIYPFLVDLLKHNVRR